MLLFVAEVLHIILEFVDFLTQLLPYTSQGYPEDHLEAMAETKFKCTTVRYHQNITSVLKELYWLIYFQG